GRRRAQAGPFCRSPIGRVESDILGDLPLPTVTVCKQPLLIEQQLFPRLRGKLEIWALYNGIDRTGLLAKPAVDAFDHVDVIAGSPARPIIAARPRLDGDCLSRA